MPLKPLSEPGVPFTITATVDHAVTNLFVLPEGSFYTVESLVLDPITGIPLRPIVDYMYFQQNVAISLITGKQVASIIQIRNPLITEVVVKGKYCHGIDQSEIDNWKAICLLYKDVPKWMNWIACLDDPLQVHPNVKRMVTTPLDERTLSDTAVGLNYMADQFQDGDSLYLPHIEYWQIELFNLAQIKYDQYILDLRAYLIKLSQDTGGKVGDFKFTDGDGTKWSSGLKNEYFGTTLKDRGADAVGSYKYLPDGSAIPSRLTHLYNIPNTVQTIQGLITTNKQTYFQSDTINITVNISQLTNRVLPNATLQLVDPVDETVVASFPITNIRVGTFNFSYNLQGMDVGLFPKKLICRIPEYMWLNPAIVEVKPTGDPSVGYITAELQGYNNVGSLTGGGFVNELKVKFKRVGTLTSPQTLYVHLSGNYPSDVLKPNYPVLQTFNFPVNFIESEVTVAEFLTNGTETKHYLAGVTVSKATDPFDQLAIVTSNVWYITAIPINPYIEWYFTTYDGNNYTRVTTLNEGNDVYVVGKCSVNVELMGVIPQLIVTSKGVGSAVEGVDFIIERSTLITIDEDTVAWKITLPFKPEQETKYKFLNVKTINSNTTELWITDKTGPAEILGSWHGSELLNAPVIDWTPERSTFYLHIEAPTLTDGTILNLSLVTPEMYRPYITFPAQVTVFAGIAVVQARLEAPIVANPDQYIKMLITGPSINYTTLGLMVVDTSKPYYEIRYIVNGLPDSLTALPGDDVRCQVRCIKDPVANGMAVLMLSGNSNVDDFVLPQGSISLLKSSTVNSVDWIDIFVTGLTVKVPMRLDYLTLTTNIIFPLNSGGVKQGLDSNATLNLRSS